MAYTIKHEKSEITYELVLSEKEAIWLAVYLKNPMLEYEGQRTKKMREQIHRSLTNGGAKETPIP